MVMTGLVFFTGLLFSGQLVSILRGQGVIGVTLGKEGLSLRGRMLFSNDPITNASIMYQCILAAVFWLAAHPTKVYCLVGIPVCACLCGVAILTGAKGPLLAFGAALLTLFVTKQLKCNVNVLLAVGLLAAILWLGQDVLIHYSGAIRHLSVGLEDKGRQRLYMSVIDSTPTLFGNGIGSWNAAFGTIDSPYVHNSVLEAYYEMGVLGAGLFLWAVAAVGLSLVRNARLCHDSLAAFILAYFIYGLTFSMFLGSIFSNAPLWLGLVLGCTRFTTGQCPEASGELIPAATLSREWRCRS